MKSYTHEILLGTFIGTSIATTTLGSYAGATAAAVLGAVFAYVYRRDERLNQLELRLIGLEASLHPRLEAVESLAKSSHEAIIQTPGGLRDQLQALRNSFAMGRK